MVWSCLPFIRSGQNHLARHSERGKTRQTKEEVGSNIRGWTVLEFAKSRRAAENREKWRKLVVKSSVVPKRPLRLRMMRKLPSDLLIFQSKTVNSCTKLIKTI